MWMSHIICTSDDLFYPSAVLLMAWVPLKWVWYYPREWCQLTRSFGSYNNAKPHGVGT